MWKYHKSSSGSLVTNVTKLYNVLVVPSLSLEYQIASPSLCRKLSELSREVAWSKSQFVTLPIPDSSRIFTAAGTAFSSYEELIASLPSQQPIEGGGALDLAHSHQPSLPPPVSRIGGYSLLPQ